LLYRLLADATVIVYLAFILFVVFGGLLALRWRRIAWLHVPAALWGALVEFTGRICPLTPLENRFRLASGAPTYDRSFIEHYLVPFIYPADLTREAQIVLGLMVVVLNAAVYGLLWGLLWRRRAGARRERR
jgi:Protein of Unknown function (DUF2784)